MDKKWHERVVSKMEKEKIDYDYHLSNVQTQINNFDNKANILLAIVSITFTLSLLLLESITGLSDTRRLLCIIFLNVTEFLFYNEYMRMNQVKTCNSYVPTFINLF